jgi:hypothetical protein
MDDSTARLLPGAAVTHTTLWASTVLGMALFTTACAATPAIRDISFLNAPIGATSGVPEIMVGTTVNLQVTGSGVCPSLTVNYGDGNSISEGQYDLSNPMTISDHAYSTLGLRGYKSIVAHGDGTDCIGQVTKRILVSPEVEQIGWTLDLVKTDPCTTGPSFLQHLINTVAFIIDIPAPTPGVTPVVGAVTIGGQQYDADGSPDLADSSFPFPGFRKYSVILKASTSNVTIAPQIIQGGKHFFFRTNRPGSTISFCYNSDRLPITNPGNVQAGFNVNLRADASQAIVP